jgi:hypothetical protein
MHGLVLAAALVLGEPLHPSGPRLEGGLSLGTDLYARGSPNQSQYAPQTRLRLAFGLSKVGLLAHFGVGVPVDPRMSIAERSGGVLLEQALGLRTMPVQRKWFRFGLWLLASYERLDRRTGLDLPDPVDPEQIERFDQRVRVHHIAPELGFEWAVPLPIAALRERDMSLALTLTHAVAFMFPLASKRTLIDPDGTVTVTRHRRAELGVLGPAGGVTVDLMLGLMFAWDGVTRRPADH